jgi:hypothetical protein
MGTHGAILNPRQNAEAIEKVRKSFCGLKCVARDCVRVDFHGQPNHVPRPLPHARAIAKSRFNFHCLNELNLFLIMRFHARKRSRRGGTNMRHPLEKLFTIAMLAVAVASIALPLTGQTLNVRWLTNSITVPRVTVNGASYTNAAIRKGGGDSVIIRHSDGFFSTHWTNLPRAVRTNMIYHPPRSVSDFINSNTNLPDFTAIKLLRGEVELSVVKEEIERQKRRTEELIAKEEERARIEALEKKRIEDERKEAEALLRLQEERKEKEFAQRNPELFRKIKTAITEKAIILGMRKKDALAAWGEPKRKTETVTKAGISEQWVYDGTYLHFEDGILTSWSSVSE